MLTPILIENIKQHGEGKIKYAKIDIDKLPDIAQMFGVQSIPAVFLIKEGDILDQFLGVKSANEIPDFIKKGLE
jgi:thioredoxin-like negative regulator of GroEL